MFNAAQLGSYLVDMPDSIARGFGSLSLASSSSSSFSGKLLKSRVAYCVVFVPTCNRRRGCCAKVRRRRRAAFLLSLPYHHAVCSLLQRNIVRHLQAKCARTFEKTVKVDPSDFSFSASRVVLVDKHRGSWLRALKVTKSQSRLFV